MKKAVFLLALVACSLSLMAQDLHFRADGTFKILQFTDTHLRGDNERAIATIQLVRQGIATEQPDLIIFTGDVVTDSPAEKAWNDLLPVLAKEGYPFVILNGNHDTEDLDYPTISRLVTQTAHNRNQLNEQGVLTDQVLPVLNAQNKAKALLYLFDSHSMTPVKRVGGYDWIRPYQIDWYRRQSQQFIVQTGDTLPALAFMHIPLCEYQQVVNDPKVKHVGTRLENECPAKVNSGLFAAMVEQGDVMGLFSGHDHDNDYVTEPYLGISLGYGRFSGSKNTYIELMPGYRIITLREGERAFSTYVKLKDGRAIKHYPEALAAQAQATPRVDWMKDIPGQTPMHRLTLPATHDSGAQIGGEYLQTQDRSIAEQLTLGIRGFDMRLKPHEDGQLGIYHSSAYQHITWAQDVLPAMLTFLKDHPSETLVVSMMNENRVGPEDYARLLSQCLNEPIYKDCFVWDFRPDITLDECRGKIVFLHRSELNAPYPGARCLDWGENMTFTGKLVAPNGTQCALQVEDDYGLRYYGDSPRKTELTLANIERAQNSTDSTWFLSYCSATASPTNGPLDFAERVNPAVGDELEGITAPCGMVLIDFAGRPWSQTLIERLIACNRGLKP